MRVLIIGGDGFLGRKLTQALIARGRFRGAAIEALLRADLHTPEALPAPFPVIGAALDIADRQQVAKLFEFVPDVVFHLAAVVSGQAEVEFETGLRTNLFGSCNVFDAARSLGTRPVVVFTSSLTVYGGDVPEPITDHTLRNPQTSYGAQKAASELLLNDYSRRGYLDGRGLRLPSVTIRPGKPNRAASSFVSSMFREPLRGETAICPVEADFKVWITAPRNAIANLIHAAELDAEAFGKDRCLGLPGITASIGEMVEAMRRVAGDEPVERIRWEPDPVIESIVGGWKAEFDIRRARDLGFVEDKSFEDNVRWFLEDDLRAGATAPAPHHEAL